MTAMPSAPLSGRVLLVDRNQEFQQQVRTLLEEAGAAVDIVDCGRKAFETTLLANARNRPYQLVLLDHDLPEWDGCRTAERLREAGYRLPIVGLSAHTNPAIRRKFLAAGCESIVLKPVHEDLLIVHLTTWLCAPAG